MVAESDVQVNQRIEKIVGGNRNFAVVGSAREGGRLLEVLRQTRPEVLLLSKELPDARKRDSDGIELCRLISAEFPFMAIIITSESEEPDDMRKSMRAGARDFISVSDLDERLVPSAVEIVTKMRAFDVGVSDKKGKVITVISPKGGIGRTTFCLNMAAELAKRSKVDSVERRVVVLDYDIQFGDASYLGGLKPPRTIADLNDKKSVDVDALESHIAEHPSNFFLLAAPKDPALADKLKGETLQQVVDVSRKIFDYTIIDTQQGFNRTNLPFLDVSDLIIVVSNSDLATFKNVRGVINTLNEYLDSPSTKIRLLINRYDKNGVPAEEISRKLKVALLGVIPKSDNLVTACNNYSKLVVLEHPNSDVAKAIHTASMEVIALLEEKVSVAKGFDPGQRKGVFSRVFSK